MIHIKGLQESDKNKSFSLKCASVHVTDWTKIQGLFLNICLKFHIESEITKAVLCFHSCQQVKTRSNLTIKLHKPAEPFLIIASGELIKNYQCAKARVVNLSWGGEIFAIKGNYFWFSFYHNCDLMFIVGFFFVTLREFFIDRVSSKAL